ncbi:MAG: DNA-directed RNA polymerase subunit beta, partial [Selenomonadaceae bacterium]|nr:DNA-directed RNA polymerase subunit beta [Selenomonadaceae bacterium]
TIDPTGKKLYNATVIPNRGAWIELETDTNDIVSVRIDRTRKMPVTYFIRALGFSTNEEILALFGDDERIRLTLEHDNEVDSKEKALIEIYRRLRPGEPATVENAQQLLNALFFDPKRYDLATVGRYKLTKKLGWKRRILGKVLAEPIVDQETGEILVPADEVVTESMLDAIDAEREKQIFGVEDNTDIPGMSGRKQIVLHVRNGEGGVLRMLCSSTLDIHADRTIAISDIIASINYLLNLMDGVGSTDDIDHLGNRRVCSVGELLQNQFRIGLSRMERVVRERMTIQDSDIITPQALINIRPVVAAIKEFFGSSQLSQFMDQHNPLSELTHKRRLSALGPGGLSRERAGFEVRDVHNSHYGRMCPIETPEGPNIGLIGSLSNYARVNQFGFMETPYRRVDKQAQRVTDEVRYLTADEEDVLTIAQANEPLDENDWFKNARVTAHYNEETMLVRRERVDYMDVSPKQVVSIATAMIPFLENDDANRALMGANMQRQAVPLLRTQAPLIGTGMEYKAACDSGVMILAKSAGTVESVTADIIEIRRPNGALDRYKLQKYLRSNQGTCINQVPIVYKGDEVFEGQPIADGPATDHGERALGYNILVAYMPWEGYNYEDAILLSENLVKRDLYTSIHIEEYECDARDTKLGPEEITRDIPNVAEEALKDLDDEGIISIGADVRPGDILVGKVTPKGETELTAEERLLRAIFGEKAREVRDTSLRVPHGEAGKIVDVKIFTRENNDELPPGVNRLVRVYIAQKRKISVGDKMSGRHGNKGVVSRIMRQEDMPFLPDGTPVDIVLNPLGVPSRMNIGQVLETHLGMAVRLLGQQIKSGDPTVQARLEKAGYDFEKNGMPKPDVAGIHIATPVFDGAREEDVFGTIEAAGLPADGKTILYDGRTGEPFENRVTVGCVYMLKLHHLVDDKIHARSTGPYSLVTQQPLGGKAQFGGQRFGEMEVWALEAYGAAYTLQEILTVKSDDVVGRVKAYEAIVKGENIPEPGVPESFKVLIKELQSIGLDIKVLSEDAKEIMIQDEEDEDDNINVRAESLDLDVKGVEGASAPAAVSAESEYEGSSGDDEEISVDSDEDIIAELGSLEESFEDMDNGNEEE